MAIRCHNYSFLLAQDLLDNTVRPTSQDLKRSMSLWLDQPRPTLANLDKTKPCQLEQIWTKINASFDEYRGYPASSTILASVYEYLKSIHHPSNGMSSLSSFAITESVSRWLQQQPKPMHLMSMTHRGWSGQLYESIKTATRFTRSQQVFQFRSRLISVLRLVK